MLYILHGPEIYTARQKAHMLIEKLLAKKPNAAHFRLDDETFNAALLEEYVGGQGLFAERSLVVLDGTFKNSEAREVVLEMSSHLADSNNIFILLEEKIEKKHLTKLTKQAERIELFESKGTKPVKNFNIFVLTDALGNRDKRNLWVLYQKAQRSGVAPEEIYNVLLWQVNVMFQVMAGNEDGLKPFVISKAKRFLKQYSEDEVRRLSSQLVSLYHDARRGIVDFGAGLERLLLGLV